MKYAVTSHQKVFFGKNRLIDFTGMLSEKELAFFENKTHCTRDFWKSSDEARRITCSRKRAEVAAQLFEEKTLRLAFDELIIAPKKPPLPRPASIQELSSVQGVVGSALINVGCTGPSPLPVAPGDVTFFTANALLPLEHIYAPGAKYLLVVYCNGAPVYRRCETDPHRHALRDIGYAVGDRLLPETHPILLTQ